MSGKGDKPRPMNINKETYDERWDRIFGKKKTKERESKSKRK
tara:strand:- start:146 stop:271 length:126 start_codon:yes stop_codon:yes gene_type:complete